MVVDDPLSQPSRAGRKAIGWLRVSDKDQHPENQRAHLEAEAERRGDHIVEWVEVRASAYKGKHLAELTRVQGLFGERSGPKVLYVWALDRLSRQGPLAQLNAVKPIYDAGGLVISHEEPWLEHDVGGTRDLLISVFGWVGRQESEHRSHRTKAGIERRRKAGGSHGRPRNCQCGDPHKAHGKNGGPCRVEGCACPIYRASLVLLRPTKARQDLVAA